MKKLISLLLIASCATANAQMTVSTTKIGDNTTIIMWTGFDNGKPVAGSVTMYEPRWPLLNPLSQPYVPVQHRKPEPKPEQSRIRFYYFSDPVIITTQTPFIYGRQE